MAPGRGGIPKDGVDPLETDVVMCVLPLFHSYGYTAAMWTVLSLPPNGVRRRTEPGQGLIWYRTRAQRRALIGHTGGDAFVVFRRAWASYVCS